MNILINGVGGPTPRSIARNLRRYSTFNNLRIIGTDTNPYAVGLYQKEFFDATYLIPRASSPDYWQHIDRIIEENAIAIALVQPELEVLKWSERQHLGTLPCKALIPDYALCKVLIDKSAMSEALEGTGLIPAGYPIRRDEDFVQAVEDLLGYPFWIRSTTGSSGLGSLKIDSRDTLLMWIQINPGVQEFIANTYLPGRNLGCKMLYWEGQLIRTGCAERVHYIMAKVAPSGITGNSAYGRLLNEEHIVEIASGAMEVLFAKTGARKHGFFTVDLKEDESGKPYVTEVNIRHVAFTSAFAAKGANFADDTIRLILGDKEFNRDYKQYRFEPGSIFLREVDCEPIFMNESEILKIAD